MTIKRGKDETTSVLFKTLTRSATREVTAGMTLQTDDDETKLQLIPKLAQVTCWKWVDLMQNLSDRFPEPQTVLTTKDYHSAERIQPTATLLSK